jgi:transcriptional regulator GlxA family with amidase domain
MLSTSGDMLDTTQQSNRSTERGDTSPAAQLGPRVRGGLPPAALRRVREYIEAHLDETVSIQALASIATLSTYQFARAFKQSTGVTPHDYLVQCRVRRAEELLACTNLPLAEIAVAVGFADQSHCARRFRERVGISPGSYRWAMRVAGACFACVHARTPVSNSCPRAVRQAFSKFIQEQDVNWS